MIMGYDLGRKEGDKVRFSTGLGKIPISIAESERLTTVPGYLQQFVKARGLTPLSYAFYDRVPVSGGFIQVDSFADARFCRWPYQNIVKVTSRNGAERRLMFFRRLRQPTTARFNIYCESGPGLVSLSTRFEVLAPAISSDYSDTVVLSLERPASVFSINPDAIRPFKSDDPDLFVVSAELSMSMYKLVAEGHVSPQRAIDLIDKSVFASHLDTER